MIRFTCPECGKQLAVAEKFAGRNGECNGCKSRVRIPQESEVELPDSDEDPDFDALPEAPQILPAPVKTLGAPNPPGRTTVKLRHWLRLYAQLNLIMSFLVAGVPILFSGYVLMNSLVNEKLRDNAMLVGTLALWFMGTVAGGVVAFMLLNVFTLACLWGESVLRLLDRDD